MKIRILKELLQDLNKPSRLEEESYVIARNSYNIAKYALWISIIFSLVATGLVIWQVKVSPDKNQMSALLVKNQTLVSKQVELLKLSSIQIDSLISINNKLSKQVDIARDQYNMNAEIAAFKSRDYLVNKYNSFNNIVDAIMQMEPILSYHRAKRNGKMKVLRARFIDKRIEALDLVSNNLKKMDNIGSYVDDTTIVEDYGKYLSAIYQYKLLCIDFKRNFGNIDTTYTGQKMYDSIMNNINDLNDRISPVLDIGRANVKKELDNVKRVIRINDSLRKLDMSK